METLIILLRGVNVGGAGKLSMAELRKILKDAGYHDAKTYIQTGNIILRSDRTHTAVLTEVQDLIEANFGFRPSGLVLTVPALEAAMTHSPFTVVDKRFLHLVFLSAGAQLNADGLQAYCTAEEEFHLDQQCFYLSTPNGYGRSKAAEKLDKHLIADVKTARNLNSCEKILALAKTLAHSVS